MNLREVINDVRNFFKGKRRKLIFAIPIGVVVFFAVLLASFGRQTVNFDNIPVSSYSTIKAEDGRMYFTLNTESGSLFKSDKKGLEAVKDFINSDPTYSDNQKLLPENFLKNSTLDRTSQSDKSVEKKDHYFFTQTINGIPIYGSVLIVHLKNDNEVYSLDGNLVTNKEYTNQILSEERAISIALIVAKEESGTDKLKVTETTKNFINKKILDLSNDSTNRLSLRVRIEGIEELAFFRTDYYVDLVSGEILYRESQIVDALSRNLYNCQGTSSCSLARQEGGSPTSDSVVNETFTYFGDVYNFYYDTFGRDSHNNGGLPLRGFVHLPPMIVLDGGVIRCPNAVWTGASMAFCEGTTVPDVVWHEYTHGVIQYTAGLEYERQSGAINESIADMFGSTSDNNWEIGESHTSPGLPRPLRSMSDPESRGDPDALSSNLYWCSSKDSGGVHANSGIINKSFYLMVAGGIHNECNISGIGRDRSLAIIYSALDNYLFSLSNFYDFYTSVQRACNDIYTAGSDICNEVEKALQATELDQQAPGTQFGPRCTNTPLQPASCIGQPSSAPIPTSTPTITPTLAPGQPTPTHTPAPGQPTATPTTASVPTFTPTVTPRSPFQQIGTPTPTPDQFFTCEIDPKCAQTGSNIQLCPLICTPQGQ